MRQRHTEPFFGPVQKLRGKTVPDRLQKNVLSAPGVHFPLRRKPCRQFGETVVQHGVTIVGETNLPALVAADASALYARNVLDFLKLVLEKDAAALKIDLEDDIVKACLMCRDGQLLRT